MISKNYIEANLKYFDSRFRHAGSTKESLFYSKLALMELCGWIEISMDDIVVRCAKKRIKDAANSKMLHNEIVRKNYGFDYERNFRRMLIRVIGLIGTEKLERKLNKTAHSKFVSTLSSLKLARDAEAHTYVKGTTRSIDAPSLTLSRFFDVYAGLSSLDAKLRKMTF